MTSKKQEKKDTELNLGAIYSIAATCKRAAKETYQTEADQIQAFHTRMNGILTLMIEAIDETVDDWSEDEEDDEHDIATCSECGVPIREKDDEEIEKMEEMSEEEVEEMARKHFEENGDDDEPPEENQ